MQNSRPPGPPRGPNSFGNGPSGPRSSTPRTFGNNSTSGAPAGGTGVSPNYKGNNPRPQGSFGGPNAGGGFNRGPAGPRPFTPGGPPRSFGGPRPSAGPRFVKEKSKDDLRINAEITAPQVRVLDENGDMIGVLDTKEAIKRAEDAGYDLVEISPGTEPPVCKITDYGKYKYEQEKKANEARKKQKVVEVKEVKLRPMIGDHDFQIKMKHAREFFEDGDKVKFSLRFKGREMSHSELGLAIFTRIKEELKDVMKVDQEPKFEGRQVIMVSSPNKA